MKTEPTAYERAAMACLEVDKVNGEVRTYARYLERQTGWTLEQAEKHAEDFGL